MTTPVELPPLGQRMDGDYQPPIVARPVAAGPVPAWTGGPPGAESSPPAPAPEDKKKSKR